MTQELKRLVRLAGCGALLCGGVVLAQDAAPVKPAAPVAPAAGVPGKHEVSQEVKDLRGKIEAQEKAVLEKNAELKAAVEALDAQIKAKHDEGTPEARKQARDLSKQRQEKLAAADPVLKDLYAKLELLRPPRGQGDAKKAPKPAKE
jgi:hypothetical protein